MLERHRTFYGERPHQAAADGGHASPDNPRQAKVCGVRDAAACHEKNGLRIEDMVRVRRITGSSKLRNFRASIEADI
jgi:hypothetical protein